LVKLINLIEENYTDSNFNVNKLIEMASRSYAYVYEKFEFKFGISPREFIENKRLKLAYQLISQRELKITEICQKCGYSNLKTFREAFKRKYNASPIELRKRMKQIK